MDADFPAAYLEEPSIGFRFPVVHAALLQIIPHVLDSAVTAYGPEIFSKFYTVSMILSSPSKTLTCYISTSPSHIVTILPYFRFVGTMT